MLGMEKWSGKHFFPLVLISGTDNPWHGIRDNFPSVVYFIMLMRFGETAWVLFQRVKRLPRFCTQRPGWEDPMIQIRCVFLAPRRQSEQAAPRLVVGMLSAVSAKGRRGGMGGNPSGQVRGVGERAEGGPGTAFSGSELPGGRWERRAGSGSSKAAPEVIKLEK